MPQPSGLHAPLSSHSHVCLGCGCLCDDIAWSPAGDQSESRACPLGVAWYQQPLSTGPLATIEGEPATLDEALQRAREILTAARHPLVTGLTGTTIEAQRAACRLADNYGGVFDWTTSLADADSTIALQSTGQITATWGEVAQRADVVVVWGCDLADTHPRHLERYSFQPTSPWLPGGAADRTLIVVDDQKNSCEPLAAHILRLSANQHYEAFSTLRMALRGIAAEPQTVLASTGVGWDEWRQLAERMKQARFGCVIYGKRIASGYGESSAALTHCLGELTRKTRWVGMSAGAGGNFAGAANVSAWQTGYPMGVRLAAGFPEYGANEWLTSQVLSRSEVDAAIVVGDDLTRSLSEPARQTLASIPTIALHWADTETSEGATVSIRIARPVVEGGGTVCRSDGVSLPLRPVSSSAYPAPADLLNQLSEG